MTDVRLQDSDTLHLICSIDLFIYSYIANVIL